MEESHRRAKHQREGKENDDERPEDVRVGHDTKAKPGERLSLKLGLVLNVVLLFLFLLLFHFLAVDHHCSLFLEQWIIYFRIKTVIVFLLIQFAFWVIGNPAHCKDPKPWERHANRRVIDGVDFFQKLVSVVKLREIK